MTPTSVSGNMVVKANCSYVEANFVNTMSSFIGVDSSLVTLDSCSAVKKRDTGKSSVDFTLYSEKNGQDASTLAVKLKDTLASQNSTFGGFQVDSFSYTTNYGTSSSSSTGLDQISSVASLSPSLLVLLVAFFVAYSKY